ncbi:MAG: aminotransferase class V-fold PLP-dependent enzyme [Clostridiaceae bacterium]|nr:aminotransferase class V-fold PLP-dependent enzyme [Clostridiaceae bacterium]
MNNIYFDNAATSFPKPKEVLDAIMEQMINFGGSANRGSSKTVLQSSRVVLECLQALKEFF